MTKVAFLNPNATEQMTHEMVVAARDVSTPDIQIVGYTNRDGPPAIQGPKDAEACLSGLFTIAKQARAAGASVLIIGCFDDTGLHSLRATCGCPVIGLGEAACLVASISRPRFVVVTTTQGSVPEITRNITAMGLDPRCAGVVAADVPVLEILDRADELEAVVRDQSRRFSEAAVVLGCAGMSPLSRRLASVCKAPVIDPNRAAVKLAQTALASDAGWKDARPFSQGRVLGGRNASL
ncbi:MAG: aspartate/glutamate racemase family protein [Pseudomonadota bacterium]